MHEILHKLRASSAVPAPRLLLPGFYEYANGWGDRALYVRVHYVPQRNLRVEIYIDYSKPEADAGITISLGTFAARFMSLINPGNISRPNQARGISTLLGNCAVVFLKAIYAPDALLTGWAPTSDTPEHDPEHEAQTDYRRRFWAQFGVMLDAYNMFDVKIGNLRAVDDGKSCLGYFPRMLPLSAFRYAGSQVRDFHQSMATEGYWPAPAMFQQPS